MKAYQKGFSMVELMTVVAVIGILAVIAIPVVASQLSKSKAATVVSAAKKYIRLQEAYAQEHAAASKWSDIGYAAPSGSVFEFSQGEITQTYDVDEVASGKVGWMAKNTVALGDCPAGSFWFVSVEKSSGSSMSYSASVSNANCAAKTPEFSMVDDSYSRAATGVIFDAGIPTVTTSESETSTAEASGTSTNTSTQNAVMATVSDPSSVAASMAGVVETSTAASTANASTATSTTNTSTTNAASTSTATSTANSTAASTTSSQNTTATASANTSSTTSTATSTNTSAAASSNTSSDANYATVAAQEYESEVEGYASELAAQTSTESVSGWSDDDLYGNGFTEDEISSMETGEIVASMSNDLESFWTSSATDSYSESSQNGSSQNVDSQSASAQNDDAEDEYSISSEEDYAEKCTNAKSYSELKRELESDAKEFYKTWNESWRELLKERMTLQANERRSGGNYCTVKKVGNRTEDSGCMTEQVFKQKVNKWISDYKKLVQEYAAFRYALAKSLYDAKIQAEACESASKCYGKNHGNGKGSGKNKCDNGNHNGWYKQHQKDWNKRYR
ncbi:MAG: prepilin-type N-terminal cleavage/methylation domain-containing protein [Fibrobacter sp.]|nr:prepilin-type N-terminal cleavage/methylation domain-containing protein [Fibrobacter sp.]